MELSFPSIQYIKIVVILLKMRGHFSFNLCDSDGILIRSVLHLWLPPVLMPECFQQGATRAERYKHWAL